MWYIVCTYVHTYICVYIYMDNQFYFEWKSYISDCNSTLDSIETTILWGLLLMFPSISFKVKRPHSGKELSYRVQAADHVQNLVPLFFGIVTTLTPSARLENCMAKHGPKAWAMAICYNWQQNCIVNLNRTLCHTAETFTNQKPSSQRPGKKYSPSQHFTISWKEPSPLLSTGSTYEHTTSMPIFSPQKPIRKKRKLPIKMWGMSSTEGLALCFFRRCASSALFTFPKTPAFDPVWFFSTPSSCQAIMNLKKSTWKKASSTDLNQLTFG